MRNEKNWEQYNEGAGKSQSEERYEPDIIADVRKRTERTEVPENLRPENIEKLIEGKEQKKRFHPYRFGLVAAACVAVAVGAFTWQYGKQTGEPGPAGSTANSAEGSSNKKISDSKKIQTAQSYEEVYNYIKKSQDNAGTALYARGGNEIAVQDSTSAAGSSKASTESSSTASAADTGSASSTVGFSETNVRQEGVDEGDIAKTDGTYLYVREDNGRTIDIVDLGSKNGTTESGELSKYSEITLDTSYTIQEFYVNTEQKKLVVICQKDCKNQKEDSQNPTDGDIWRQTKTAAVTYDIRDVKNPVQEGEVTQSGTYNSSRMKDGYLYLFSEYYTGTNLAKDKPVTYIPQINDKEMAQTSICLPPIDCGTMYEVISSVDISKPDQTADNKAILSQGGQMYVSGKNIYYYESEWQQNNKTVTTLRKISYKNGELKAVAQGKVKGYLNDTFSLDEYKGNLRLFTTNDDENLVTILDEKLDKISTIENLAKGETIYSARFLGDAGYFVTYEQVDPLFSVDLSDPEKPKILGKLKIPGFSEYLHFYGEDRLLGIGMSTDPKSGMAEGVKVTMFNISDRTDVKEESTLVLEDMYGTNAAYDYKSVLADDQKNRIGFSGYSQNGESYCLLTYNEKERKFKTILKEEVNGNTSQGIRGIYIDNTLYVISGNIIESYNIETGEKKGDIIL